VAYAPYGEDYNGSGTTDLAFTDQNQDTAKGGWSTNLYDFILREYRTAHGRWTSPDPAGLGAVDPTNPQTWNRYAYVVNNPMAMVDLLGDDCYDNSGNLIGGVSDANGCWAAGGSSWYDPTTGQPPIAAPTTVNVDGGPAPSAPSAPNPDPFPAQICDPSSGGNCSPQQNPTQTPSTPNISNPNGAPPNAQQIQRSMQQAVLKATLTNLCTGLSSGSTGLAQYSKQDAWYAVWTTPFFPELGGSLSGAALVEGVTSELEGKIYGKVCQ